MKVVEKFISIDGEGPTAGALSVFLRFAGCNLRCSWCDTKYAQHLTDATEDVSAADLANWIKSTGINHITITGGEPLLQEGLLGLLSRLTDYQVHIETNGSIDIEKFRISNNIHFVVDYKLQGSGQTESMCLTNLLSIKKDDAYKFVISSEDDLSLAITIVKKYNLIEKTQVYFSTVFDEYAPAQVVERLKAERLNGIKLQLQLHKFIWNPNMRCV